MQEITSLSAAAMAKAIRQKKISAKEAVDACIHRIHAVNPALNAVVRLSEKSARDQASKADSALSQGTVFGPLHGVPFTAKDSLDTAGMISTGGTKGREGFVPTEDATVVRRLRAAGAILLGKTNTSELTLTYDTNNLIYGRTNNPHDLSRSPGGSSGGSAAIIAACGSAFDIGSDYGGSLRFPAHCCGITTIKPTSGRVPRTGHIFPFGGVLDGFQQIGPLARSVEDLSLVLAIIAGPDHIDPSIVPMAFDDPKGADLTKLKVALHWDNGIISPSLETQSVVRQAAACLGGQGAILTETRPPGIEQSYDLMMALLSADGGASARRLLQDAGTEEHTLRWLGSAKPIDAVAFDALIAKWYRFRSSMLSFFKNHDVILCPANAFPAMPHGALGAQLESCSYTMTYNLTGWPAAVVRGGTSPEGLPIGVQIVGHPWREDVVLAVAALIEKHMGGFQPAPI